MGDPSPEKRWIVLIQKAPRGPLTTSEVRILLHSGVVRMNDLGFEIISGEEYTEWKFLWQFAEFERRSRKEPTAAPPDRRKPVAQEQVQQQIHAKVPIDLASIAPEDLVLKSARQFNSNDSDLSNELPVDPPASSELPRSYIALGVVAFVAVGGVLVLTSMSRPSAERNVSGRSTAIRPPDTNAHLPTASPLTDSVPDTRRRAGGANGAPVTPMSKFPPRVPDPVEIEPRPSDSGAGTARVDDEVQSQELQDDEEDVVVLEDTPRARNRRKGKVRRPAEVNEDEGTIEPDPDFPEDE